SLRLHTYMIEQVHVIFFGNERVRGNNPFRQTHHIARALAKGLITPQEFASLRAAILADA
ncbi:MAG: hypothetical protein IJJ51_00275, partial [Kiritimatiellae bacterium]|nr:hypothetical protein [Kiritimatiellia bacterium]